MQKFNIVISGQPEGRRTLRLSLQKTVSGNVATLILHVEGVGGVELVTIYDIGHVYFHPERASTLGLKAIVKP